ncbi:MAG: hypothetical protein CVV49_06960 [Spirochaetae bacterium HGW-Spirochaetae-5]|nr:MAG: hypothetical protein CVV49_06960 [Spirochaetae bacterium HGW-Spirochaetae-5]
MEIQQDFKELLELFNSHKVEYIIVGSYALAHYGAPRYTGDIDLYVRPEKDNAEKIISALADFGFGSLNLSVEDFCMPDRVVQLGTPPVRIDILTSISGVNWDDAFINKVPDFYGDVPVFFIGRSDYIANKKAAGRKKDIADLEAIGADTE